MTSSLVTKSELAAHLGVHRSRISALVKRGLPFSGRTIELELEWLKANVATQARFQDRGVHRILATAVKPRNSKPAGRLSAASAKASHAPPDEALLGDETGALPYAEAKALRETYLARKAKLDFEFRPGGYSPKTRSSENGLRSSAT
jgi:hypothetical protein